MKKEWADKWVEALRSGEYAQGRMALRTHSSYCCLGVLCDIAGATFEPSDIPEPPGLYKAALDGEIDYFALPNTVQSLTGMRTSGGRFSLDENSLAELNDSGESFDEIANIIEREWENL